MDERDFEVLLALDKTRNITHAAKLLYVSQSSLSKRINAIESELQIKILIRSRKGVYFTPEGEEVLTSIRQVSKELQTMREKLDLSKNIVSGHLKAGISLNFSLFKLPEVLSEYRKQFPHVNMHVITDHSRKLYNQLLEGTIDIAVVRGDYPWKGEKILLDRENICAIKSKNNQGKSFSELPYIGRKTDLAFERELLQWMHENGYSDQSNGLYVDNITTCVEMVKLDGGWAIVPEICLKDFEGDIVPLKFANGEPFVRPTYLMFSDIVLELPQIKAFIDQLRSGPL
ncbi:LysR family transcriptional regulator [Enterococcus sp. 669A]|uniref:LysR family transcriptional regulator n=1 Tax=Candidatus Enterococcus moelleringii TaxID=2815325 RepID=A0ABS3L4J4_9ENTE|nr:LysR family transcriptional regulator [Enterococcus sp. 669A]MBO1304532.1 LysR family transcriptional regulator [Enterococcus sp. 669A]